jgi:alpha-glucosidase
VGSDVTAIVGGQAADWWRGAVIYQIYPRSFADSNGDGVGDLPGILAKLDYVASLGVDGVWLSPFFRSPMKDYGYDVSDYRDVDPLFGTLADFDAVLARAHALGLKVVIDQVWAHTSDQHPWFVESASSRDNPKADWYVWADAKADGSPPNNWQAVFGGPSWTWNARRRQYYGHDFLVEQPDLNYWQPAVRDEILAAAKFWLDRGVDGFRLDVINFIVHDPALTDNPVANYLRPPATATQYQKHIHDRSQPLALRFLGDLRALLDGYDAKMTVGEIVDEEPLVRQQEYTEPPNRLHTAYSFFLLSATKAPPALFAEALNAWNDAAGWPAWSLGNHDIERFATRLGGDDPAHVRILMAVLVCLRGTIFLYQGEELGLPQAHVPFDRLRDPFAIAAYTGGSGRDGARTPIPWTAANASAGFSTSPDTWLPVDDAQRPLAVDRQESDPGSMLNFTRKLIALRRGSAALREGAATVVGAPEGVLAFEREAPGERLLCVFELSGQGRVVPVPAGSAVLAVFGEANVRENELVIGEFSGALVLLPLREKVAPAGGRMRGRADASASSRRS